MVGTKEDVMPQVGGEPEGQKSPPLYKLFPTLHVFEFRRTRMGGYTKHIVVCMTCKAILLPTSVRRTKRGTHGEDIYMHESKHDIQYAILSSSNSGKRSVAFTDGFPESIREYIKIQWTALAREPTPDELESVWQR